VFVKGEQGRGAKGIRKGFVLMLLKGAGGSGAEGVEGVGEGGVVLHEEGGAS